MALLSKIAVPYPGYRIVEEVYMKHKYIELCYFYVGSLLLIIMYFLFSMMKATVLLYSNITRTSGYGEDAILFML
jgi:hypothetical protein